MPHTPGPWFVTEKDLITHAKPGTIARVYPSHPSIADTDTMLANAALIAAAPKLLATLKEARQRVKTELDIMLRSNCVMNGDVPDVSTIDDLAQADALELANLLTLIDGAIDDAEGR